MTQTLLALIVFLAPLAYSPGPGNLFFAAAGARFGLPATVPALMGYHLATWIAAMAIGLGLTTALQGHPTAMRALTLTGAAYVLWLAWKLAGSGPLDADGPTAPRATALDGAVLLLLNPKAYVIMALMFSQFLPRVPTDSILTTLIIATAFTANNLLAFAVWTALGDRLAARFRSDRGARHLNLAFGGMLGAVAVWMALR